MTEEHSELAVVDITVVTPNDVFVAHRDGLRTYHHTASALDLRSVDWRSASWMVNQLPYLEPQKLFEENSNEALFLFYNKYSKNPCPILRVTRKTYGEECVAVKRLCSWLDEELDKCPCCLTDLKFLVFQEKQLVELNECKHVFCKDCVVQVEDMVCPMCREPFTGFRYSEKKTAMARMLNHHRGVKRSRDVVP